jgi:outer membrane receptor protein involved in Fe transport
VSRLTIRTTWFDNRITNPVANVTIGNNGNLQQRQNLGATRIWGIQSDAEYLIHTSWRFSAGYLFNRARVLEFAANPALALNCPGNLGQACVLPQVPANRGSFRLSYSNPRYATVTIGVQFIGKQFDDDQNLRGIPAPALADAGYPASVEPGLPRYTVADLTASRAIRRDIDLFFGVQNLFNRQYFVGTLPTTIGSPRMVNGGVRIRFTGR